jgi:hypothetical protein
MGVFLFVVLDQRQKKWGNDSENCSEQRPVPYLCTGMLNLKINQYDFSVFVDKKTLNTGSIKKNMNIILTIGIW